MMSCTIKFLAYQCFYFDEYIKEYTEVQDQSSCSLGEAQTQMMKAR